MQSLIEQTVQLYMLEEQKIFVVDYIPIISWAQWRMLGLKSIYLKMKNVQIFLIWMQQNSIY